MTPTPTSDRRDVPAAGSRAAVVLVLSALLLTLSAPLLLVAPAHAGPENQARPENRAGTEIFTGRAQGGFVAVPGDRTSQRIRFAVEEVWGDSLLRDTEVAVIVPRAFVQRCDRAAGGTGSGAQGERQPAVDGVVRYVVRAQRVGEQLTATKCAQIRVLTGAERQRLLDTYGEPRPPETTPGGEETAPEPVVFTCPDDDAVLGDVEAERAQCPALAEPEEAGRAALPGAAVALVGLLGLLVARWGARRARR